HYTLAPNELRPKKEILEKEFLSLAEAEGISDIETLNKVLEKAVRLKNMLKNKQRIKNIAKFVKKHFTKSVEPMDYKAFLVAVDREACVLYKKELDKILPKEYSEVIISSAQNDPPELAKYHYSKEKEKRIRKAFRKADKLPKILIVTEKLLTGFDAPILYCMYLDKPMRDHVLLQAIARVNRPYEDEEGRKKQSGFVLDFVGIFDKLEKALAFDSRDIKDIENVVRDIKVLKERFKELIQKAKKEYLSLIKRKTKDKAVEIILKHFRDEEKRQAYYEFYEELADVYEILSPDAFLRPYLEDYDTLSRIYKILKEAYEPGLIIDKEFTRKTAKLVQKHTKTKKIKSTLDIYEINEHTLKKLEESNASDTEKVFNLLKSIGITVQRDAGTNPYLVSIGEKAELISIMYRERQKTTKETLDELKKIIDQINNAKREQIKKKMPLEAFSIYWILNNENIPNPENIAKEMNNVLKEHPYWRTSEEYERKVKQEIYKIFKKNKIGIKKSVRIVTKILDVLKRSKK
ncbi:MAG: type I restriction endonuclease subunit R, partial [Candidatus Aenigmatarchaeota archaeon]